MAVLLKYYENKNYVADLMALIWLLWKLLTSKKYKLYTYYFNRMSLRTDSAYRSRWGIGGGWLGTTKYGMTFTLLFCEGYGKRKTLFIQMYLQIINIEMWYNIVCLYVNFYCHIWE